MWNYIFRSQRNIPFFCVYSYDIRSDNLSYSSSEQLQSRDFSENHRTKTYGKIDLFYQSKGDAM